jgi:hypothetical protein
MRGLITIPAYFNQQEVHRETSKYTQANSPTSKQQLGIGFGLGVASQSSIIRCDTGQQIGACIPKFTDFSQNA